MVAIEREKAPDVVAAAAQATSVDMMVTLQHPQTMPPQHHLVTHAPDAAGHPGNQPQPEHTDSLLRGIAHFRPLSC